MFDRNLTIIVNTVAQLSVKGVTLASKAAYRKLSKKGAPKTQGNAVTTMVDGQPTTIIIHQPTAV